MEKVIFFLYLFFTFLPSQYGGTVVVTFLLIFMVGILAIRFRRKFMSPLELLFILYIVIVLGVTIYWKNADIHTVIWNMKKIVGILYTAYFLKTDFKYVIYSLVVILSFLCIINSIDLVLHPDGSRIDQIEVNQWYTAELQGWFLGRGNNQFNYYFLWLISSFILYKWTKPSNAIDKSAYPLAIGFTFISYAIINSSTSIACLLLFVLSSLDISKRFVKLRHPAVLVYFFLFLSFGFIIGQMEFLSSAMNSIFGKDASFTGRTDIWMMGIVMFLQRPLIGYGSMTAEQMTDLLGNYQFVNMHNQLMQTMIDGGLVLLCVYVALFVVIAKLLNKSKSRYILVCTMIIVCMEIHSYMEIGMGFYAYLEMAVACRFAEVSQRNCKKTYKISSRKRRHQVTKFKEVENNEGSLHN